MSATSKYKAIGLLSLLATIVVLYELNNTWEVHPKESITNTLSATNTLSLNYLRGVSTETTRQLLEYETLHNAGDRQVLRNGSIKGNEQRLAQNDDQSLDEDGRYICVNESEVYKELANEKRSLTKVESIKPTFVNEETESWAKEIHFEREDRLRERESDAEPGHGLNLDTMKLQLPGHIQKEVFVIPLNDSMQTPAQLQNGRVQVPNAYGSSPSIPQSTSKPPAVTHPVTLQTRRQTRIGKQERKDRLHFASKVVTVLESLQNYAMPVVPDLEHRDFPAWKNTSEAVSHLGYLQKAIEMTDQRMVVFTKTSLNPNIVARGKFQRSQMEKFCKRHKLNSHLPNALENLGKLFHHLLYDDSKKLVFCYVPKNGCSNMKRLLLILNGVLPPESANMTRPSDDVLKQVCSLCNGAEFVVVPALEGVKCTYSITLEFASEWRTGRRINLPTKVKSFKSLTAEQAIYRLQNYYKAVIVRNPMERLISAYRAKVEPPFVFADKLVFPDKVKFFILQLYRKTEIKTWYFSRNRTNISPTFSEFVRFMTLYPLSYYNEHFNPVLELCYPCAVQYDFYPNFKSLDYDLYAMFDYLNIPSEYYPQVIAHSKRPTEIFLDDFFSEVPHSEKERLFEVFSNELDFYYSLYPEERNMHSKL